jgi:hypothetical protein
MRQEIPFILAYGITTFAAISTEIVFFLQEAEITKDLGVRWDYLIPRLLVSVLVVGPMTAVFAANSMQTAFYVGVTARSVLSHFFPDGESQIRRIIFSYRNRLRKWSTEYAPEAACMHRLVSRDMVAGRHLGGARWFRFGEGRAAAFLLVARRFG